MIISGTSSSRLSELKKYKITDVFEEMYYSGGSITNNGVVYSESEPENMITYYIGGVKYFDDVSANTTTYYFEKDCDYNDDFIDYNIYKDPNKTGIVGLTKIVNDVFIERQELSVFEKNYMLEHVNNLSEVITFAGGRYFNIINNG